MIGKWTFYAIVIGLTLGTIAVCTPVMGEYLALVPGVAVYRLIMLFLADRVDPRD